MAGVLQKLREIVTLYFQLRTVASGKSTKESNFYRVIGLINSISCNQKTDVIDVQLEAVAD